MSDLDSYTIALAGTSYVNLSIATLLFQHHQVTAVERAPLWWQEHSLEWLYRLIKEPKRMWRRYIIGNALFLINIFKEKFQ